MTSAVLQFPQVPPRELTVMSPMLELLEAMIVPRENASGVGGKVTVVWSWPEPCR